ncbi:MAG TPA: site-specific integrase [Thermomicrobiales bacterium]|nr:site-specific integrase [Thermomicrobiales bacterium]
MDEMQDPHTTRQKRGQNEGSAYQRKDGRWEALLTLPADAPGGPARRSFYGKTKKEAMTKLRAAQRKLDEGLPAVPERETVGTYLDRWLIDVAKPGLRASTYKSYESYVRLHLKPALGHHRLARLGPQHVQTMLNEKLAAGLSPRTVQYIRAILRRSLGQALKWGLGSRNVATLIDPPKGRRVEVRPLTPEQARCFLDFVNGDRLEALYSVAVALGLRQGEALGLQWEDIDFTSCALRVRHALQRVDGKLRLVEPKSERSRRTVDIPAPTLAILVAHRDRQAFERAFAGDRWQDWGLVFTTPKGTPLDGTAVTKRLQRLLADAELPRQRFHDLRHCCASLLLAQGVPPRVVMEILGHSQISLTMDTYSHVMPTARRHAAELMGAILANS